MSEPNIKSKQETCFWIFTIISLALLLDQLGVEGRNLDLQRSRNSNVIPLLLPFWRLTQDDAQPEGAERSASQINNAETMDDDSDDDSSEHDDYIDDEPIALKPLTTDVVPLKSKPQLVLLNPQGHPVVAQTKLLPGDESRFFKHKAGGGGGGGGSVPSFIVLTTPLNLTNVNNNNISLATTTPAPGGTRSQFFRDTYPANIYRGAPSTVFRQHQQESPLEHNGPLPYGLFAYDGNNVLPLSMTDLRYMRLNLRQFGDGDRSDNHVDSYDYENPQSSSIAETTKPGFGLFGRRWRSATTSKPNLYNYERFGLGGGSSNGGFSAFANNFGRIQYL